MGLSTLAQRVRDAVRGEKERRDREPEYLTWPPEQREAVDREIRAYSWERIAAEARDCLLCADATQTRSVDVAMADREVQLPSGGPVASLVAGVVKDAVERVRTLASLREHLTHRARISERHDDEQAERGALWGIESAALREVLRAHRPALEAEKERRDALIDRLNASREAITKADEAWTRSLAPFYPGEAIAGEDLQRWQALARAVRDLVAAVDAIRQAAQRRTELRLQAKGVASSFGLQLEAHHDTRFSILLLDAKIREHVADAVKASGKDPFSVAGLLP